MKLRPAAALARPAAALLAALTLFVHLAAGAAVVVADDGAAVMTPDQIKKGMKGYGLTVFGGETIERFEVEVLGVIKGRSPSHDTIIVRASGGVIDCANVSAGMSGSPVFIEGKLIGALAFAWGFAREAVAGVQPIGAMREAADRPAAPPKSPEERRRAAAQFGQDPSAVTLKALDPTSPGSRSLMASISTPVVLSGFTGAAGRELEAVLGRLGFLPVPLAAAAGPGGPGSSAATLPSTASAPLPAAAALTPATSALDDVRPGSAVGVSLIRGDLEVAAIGTLTLREGNRILAFGHPLMNLGDVRLPLSRADVQTVMPSLALSFKMANASGLIGTLVRDADAGIVGLLGVPAPSVPLNVTLKRGARTARFHFDVALHEQLTPLLVRAAVSNVVEQEVRDAGPCTLSVALRLKLAGYDEVATTNTFASPAFPGFAVASSLAPLFALLANSVEEVRPERVDLDVEASDDVRLATIDSVRWLKAVYAPGEEVRAAVVLRPWRGDLTFQELTLTLPDDLPAGKLTVEVVGGKESLLADQARNPGKYDPRSVDQMQALVAGLPDFRSIVASYGYGRPGASLAGAELPQLPSSLVAVVETARGVAFQKLQEARRVSVLTPWVIQGRTEFTIEIERNPARMGRASAKGDAR